jgi:hypothetical protein
VLPAAASSLPGYRAMSKEPPYDQNVPLEERLAEQAKRLRARAKTLPPGPLREEVLQKAEQAEKGVDMSRLLRPSSTSKTR